jgi:hypothetical protein
MSDNDPPTCGTGLAANAALPAKIAELTAITADVLERHRQALDLSDPDARKEFDAYVTLERAHREIARKLEALAGDMTGYRDLPMGRHDMQIMAGRKGKLRHLLDTSGSSGSSWTCRAPNWYEMNNCSDDNHQASLPRG